ncbi:MAG: DUF4836 family protein [Chitinophagaceae bacterium]
MKLTKLIASSLLFLSFCVSSNAQVDLIKYLPENASAIISLNSASLKQKMTWQELAQSKFFEALVKKAPMEVKPFLSNPDGLGLDRSPEVIIAIVGDEKNPKNGYAAAFIRMKNIDQFTEAIQKLFKNHPIKTIGANKIMIDQDGAFGWNKDMAVITMGENNKEFRSAKTPKAMTVATENKFKTLTDRCIRLLTVKLNSSYTKDPRFTSLMSSEGDIRMWSTSSFKPLQDIFNKKKQAVAVSPKLKGGVKAAVINFDNGQISWQTKSYLAKSVDSLYKIYPGNKINTDAAGRLPGGDVLAYISMNYSFDLFKALFEIAGVKDMAKGAFKNNEFKGQDFSDALAGDLTIAVVKADEFAVDDSLTQNLGGLQLFLTGGIKDKSKFEKIAASIKKKSDSLANGNGKGAKFLSGLKDGLQYDDKSFVLSLSPQAAAGFMKRSPAAALPVWLQSYNSAPAFVSLDLKSIFSLIMQMKKGNTNEESQELLKSFDRLVYSGGTYNTDHLDNKVEIQFTDKSQNSLKQFISIIGTAADAEMRKRDAMMKDDELPPPPPKEKN